MDRLVLPGTLSTPAVDFDPDSGRLSLRGESYPEHSSEFFRPILAWLQAFLDQAGGAVSMEVELTYLNTSSIKAMMDILDLLEEAHLRNRQVSFTWYYDPENDRALEMAEEFQEEVSLPFFVVPRRPEAPSP